MLLCSKNDSGKTLQISISIIALLIDIHKKQHDSWPNFNCIYCFDGECHQKRHRAKKLYEINIRIAHQIWLVKEQCGYLAK